MVTDHIDMLKPHREADIQWSWRTSRLVTIPKRVLCPKEFLGLSESLPNCSWVESFIVNRWQILNRELSWDLWTVLDNWENYGNSWLHTQSREIMDFYTCTLSLSQASVWELEQVQVSVCTKQIVEHTVGTGRAGDLSGKRKNPHKSVWG